MNHRLTTQIVVCLVLFLVLPTALAASPPITWRPARSEVVIGTGQGATLPMEVTFESSQRLEDIRVEVVPELRPFVRLTPSHFADVEPSKPQTVTLDFRLPPNAEEGIYEGTVHLRQGKRTLPATFKLEIHVAFGGNLVKPTTRSLGDETLATLISVNGGTFIFSHESPELEALNAGDVLVLPVSSVLPAGALCQVTDTYASGQEFVVETAPASLEDVFENARLDLVRDLTPADLALAENVAGAALVPAKDVTGGFGFEVLLENLVLVDADGSPSTTHDQVRLNGSILLASSFDLSLRIEDGRVEDAELVNTLHERSELMLFSELALISVEAEVKIAEYLFSPLTVWVGWVPVVVVPVLQVHAGADGEVSVRLETSVVHEAELQGGAAYHDGAWSPVSSFEQDFTFDPPHVSADAEAEAWGGPTLSLLFYGLSGPAVHARAYLRLDASLQRCPDWWHLYGGLRADLLWKLEVLGRFHAGEVRFSGFIAIEWLLSQADRCQLAGPCVLFHSDRMGSIDVWMSSLDGTQIRLTDKPGVEFLGRVTPDGSKFAYKWDGHGDPSLAGIYLKAFDGSSDVKILSYSGPWLLGGMTAWSPDGSRFLYTLYSGWYGQTRIANLQGQDLGLFLAPRHSFRRAGVTDWRNGKIVYVMGSTHSGTNRVFIADEDGSNERELSGGRHGDHIRLNADATRASYFNVSNVTLVDTDGNNREVLYTDVQRTGFLPFLPGEDRIAFAGFGHDNMANDLYTVTIAEPHELTRVTETRNVYYVADVAPRCITSGNPD